MKSLKMANIREKGQRKIKMDRGEKAAGKSIVL